MLNAKQILVSAIVLACCALQLTGCGQTGPLYLPSPPGATAPR
ncbi:MAG: lipoprotein [Rhodoferax sp.]|nr:lipoprotein [Rhodoferax sp.]